MCLSLAALTSIEDEEVRPADMRLCPWAYVLDCDDMRYPPVLVVAKCLRSPELCQHVFASITVERTNQTTGQLYWVSENYSVACEQKPDPLNHDDYD